MGYFKSHPYVSNFSLRRALLILHFTKLTFGSLRNSKKIKTIMSCVLSITADLFFPIGKTERRKENRTILTAERVDQVLSSVSADQIHLSKAF